MVIWMICAFPPNSTIANWNELCQETNTKLNLYLKPILNVLELRGDLLGRAEAPLCCCCCCCCCCCWDSWEGVTVVVVVVAELSKRLVMSARGTLLGFRLLRFFFLKDVGTMRGIWVLLLVLVSLVLLLHGGGGGGGGGGGTFSLSLWSEVVVAAVSLPLASICGEFEWHKKRVVV